MSQPAEPSTSDQHVPEAEAVPARRTRTLATAMLILAIAVIALRLAEFVARLVQRISVARIFASDDPVGSGSWWNTILEVSNLFSMLLETAHTLASVALIVVAILLAVRAAGRGRNGAVLVALTFPAATAVLALYRLLQGVINRISDPFDNRISEPLAYLGLGLNGLVTIGVAIALLTGARMVRRWLATGPHGLEAGPAAGAARPRALAIAGLILAAATIGLWFAELATKITTQAAFSVYLSSGRDSPGPLYDITSTVAPFVEAASILSATALTVVAVLLAIRTAGRGRVGAIIVALTYPVATGLLAVYWSLEYAVDRILGVGYGTYGWFPFVALVVQGLVIVAAAAAIAVGTLMTRRWIARR